MTILEMFHPLPAISRHQLCYVYPLIICDIFPTRIELLEPSAKMPNIDRIVAKTKEALGKIWEEQRQGAIKRSTMTIEELQELCEPSTDRVDEFNNISYEKGMWSGYL